MISAAQNAWNKISLLVMLHYAHQGQGVFVDNLRVQKTAFLAELRGRQQGIKAAYYPFFRYTYGPYSKELANDVCLLEEREFVEPESRMLTDRGKYLYRYVKPEIENSSVGKKAIELAQSIAKELRPLKSSRIVDNVYQLSIPVDGLGGKIMKVKEIPLHTDMLIPSQDIQSKHVDVLDESLIKDIEEELRISPDKLDPNTEAFRESVERSFQRALAN